MPSTLTQFSAASDQSVASLRAPAGSTSCIGTNEWPAVALVRHLLFPISAIGALLLSTIVFAQPITRPYLILGALTFALSWRVLGAIEAHELKPFTKDDLLLPRVLYGWARVLGLLLFVGFIAKMTSAYSRAVIVTWTVATPAVYFVAHTLAYRFLCAWNKRGRIARTHVIVGNNARGQELAKRLEQEATLGTFIGFFDRDAARPGVLGSLEDLPEYVRRNGIEVVHIADSREPDARIKRLLDDLRDTTTSIYFLLDVPDQDGQTRIVDIAGIPALVHIDTPHYGLNGVTKRVTDISLSLLLLAVLWPVLLAIAIAVRLDSPGPAIFKQRRYGLKGEEIAVYKFRTMRVCDDGNNIVQASRNDPRCTRIGRFLRRSSLDELPQLFCVLAGSMSLVGPRPHAVAQNEQYRRLIDGYMLRHKVRPGISGWAQVNGLRGETRTVEQMRRRVRYDLEYLRNWSLWIDVKILLRTALLVIRDRNAY